MSGYKSHRHSFLLPTSKRGGRFCRAGFRWLGMTLIELSVALALAALLMVAILGVLSGVENRLEALERTTTSDWTGPTVQAIAQDLWRAQIVSAQDGELILQGAFPAVVARVEGSRLESEVRYFCQPWLEGEVALVRQAGSERDLVAIGPSRVAIERLDASGIPQPISTIETSAPYGYRILIWNAANELVVESDVVVR